MNKKKEPYFKGKAEKGLAGAGAAAAVANLGYTGRNFYKEVIKKARTSTTPKYMEHFWLAALRQQVGHTLFVDDDLRRKSP